MGSEPWPAGIHVKLAASHPSLTRGQVWCRNCGHTERVDSAHAMRHGWPKCCGATMTIDSPDEQVDLRKGEADKLLPWCNACDMRATGRWAWCTDPGGWGIRCDGKALQARASVVGEENDDG